MIILSDLNSMKKLVKQSVDEKKDVLVDIARYLYENPELGSEEFKKKFGMAQSYEELVEKYGKENADYLWEEIGGYSKNYGKLTFIEMGIEPSDSFEKETREEADERGMEFEKVQGDMVLIERLVNGEWEGDDFLVIQPGHRVVARHDERIIDTEPAT